MDSEVLEIEEELVEERPHISYSQISMFLRCPMQWYHRYVEGKKSPPGMSLVRGTSYHSSLETNFSQKILTGTDISLEDMLCAYVEKFDDVFYNEEVYLFPEDNVPDIKDSGVKMITAYYKSDIMQPMQPKAVERKIVKEITGTGIDLVGVIDLELTNGKIIDHKTASKSWAADKGVKDHQSTTYAILLDKDTIDFEYQIAVNTKVAQIQIVNTPRSTKHIEYWNKVILSVIKEMDMVRNGLFIPRTDTWACSTRWCGYYKDCQPLG